MENLLNDLLKLAINAHNGTSFSPEKRGINLINEFEIILKDDLKQIETADENVKKQYIERFRKHFVNWLNSKSRIVSTMIAGASNFPVYKMQKYNNWERSAYDKFYQFRKKAIQGINRKIKKEKNQSLCTIQNQEFDFDNGKIIYNYAMNRLQVLHYSKPDTETIKLFKTNGFRWSPSNKVWQYNLHNRAIDKAKTLLNIVIPYL